MVVSFCLSIILPFDLISSVSFHSFLADNGVLGYTLGDDGGRVADELLAGLHRVGVGGGCSLQQTEAILAQDGVLGSQPLNHAEKVKRREEKKERIRDANSGQMDK